MGSKPAGHPPSSMPARRRRERGQVLPLFAVMATVMLGGAALLSDVAWWWVNQQRMQRAADAGALAGAVHLPANEPVAFSRALLEASKNGFTNGVGGVTVTPKRDPGDPRKLIVDIAGPVGTNFAKVFDMDQVDVSVTGAASYVLPVPMGSPENFYGVGFFQGVIPGTSTTTTDHTGWHVPNAVPNGSWTNPTFAYVKDESPPKYATRVTNTSNDSSTYQAYRDFGISIPDGAAITGIEFRADAYAGDATGCTLRVALNHAAVSITDGSWTSNKEAALGASPPETPDPAILGGPTDTWGRSWTEAQVESSNFRVRVQARDPGTACTNAATVYLDSLEVRVHHSTTVTTPPSYPVLSVPDPLDASSSLASQGFWGAIFTSGGVRENGDRYAPLHIGAGNPPDGTNGGPNPNYDPDGYDYTIEVGPSGQVRLFDPLFCATGPNLSGGWFGTGDHWTTDGSGGGTTVGPVAVEFTLFDSQGTPYLTSDDVQVGSTLTYDPGSATLGDLSGSFGTPQNSSAGSRQDCANHPAHNQWVRPTGWSGLPAGTYRLNVDTNLGQNAAHGAENLFAIWVKGDGRSRVYGGGRMAAYTNLDDSGGGKQQFYFSQIEDVHAGKTMVITLFDPGEASSPSYLRFLSPEGNSYDYATFDWYSNDGRSGTNVDVIQTSTGTPLFNNRIITIEVPLSLSYGAGGLDPNGLGEQGWWVVEYDVRAGNDTTTWEVEIRGNPVHLVLE